jgi:hypothetical protein
MHHGSSLAVAETSAGRNVPAPGRSWSSPQRLSRLPPPCQPQRWRPAQRHHRPGRPPPWPAIAGTASKTPVCIQAVTPVCPPRTGDLSEAKTPATCAACHQTKRFVVRLFCGFWQLGWTSALALGMPKHSLRASVTRAVHKFAGIGGPWFQQTSAPFQHQSWSSPPQQRPRPRSSRPQSRRPDARHHPPACPPPWRPPAGRQTLRMQLTLFSNGHHKVVATITHTFKPQLWKHRRTCTQEEDTGSM